MSSRSFPQREIFQVQTFESVAEDPKIFENMQVFVEACSKSVEFVRQVALPDLHVRKITDVQVLG